MMKTDNTINGRTPEEIKKGLECCKPVWVDNHWKTCDTKCPYIDDVGGFCRAQLMADALALIQQLENHIGELTEMVQQLERERDAAVEILRDFKMCAGCDHKGCADCRWFDDVTMKNKDLHDNWQWRGVQEEVKPDE